MSDSQHSVVKENGAFLRVQQDAKLKRLLDVARLDREVSVSALANRFGKSREYVRMYLAAAGLERQPIARVCALGSVGVKRGIDMKKLDPEDPRGIAEAFGVARQLVAEIEYENDESDPMTPEERWKHMRKWAESNLRPEKPKEGAG